MSFVKMLLDDNKGNQIILPHATWKTFITKCADIEKLTVNHACIVDSKSDYRTRDADEKYVIQIL